MVEQGVFSIAHLNDAIGHRVYKPRFVDEIRDFSSATTHYNYRLVVQAFLEKLTELLTYKPKVLRMSQRLMVCIAATFQELIMFLRYITKAYPQSLDPLLSPVFIQPPKALFLPHDVLLRLEIPLYGIP